MQFVKPIHCDIIKQFDGWQLFNTNTKSKYILNNRKQSTKTISNLIKFK